ncbi:MAG: group 1 truncated hemoglobin [Burkholderiales bacterium]|nr:group 1 truncated hemoglobin [Burkholderiales bacterium]
MSSIVRKLCQILGFATLVLSTNTYAQESETTFTQFGGKEGIEKVIAAFIPIIQADRRIAANFKDTDMDLLARQLTTQICQVTGGPCERHGDDMQTVHRGMKITELQFNALAEDLQIAMEQLGIANSAQNKLIAKLVPMRRDIVGK